MARATIVRNSFNAGELSPLMAARVDQARYPNGCASLCNMLLHPHGGAWRRPGLRFMGLAADPAGPVRLIPFVFSEAQAYVLEFGPRSLRIWHGGGLVLGGDGEPFRLETPWAGEQLTALRWCQSADMLYLVSHAGPPRRLERHGHADWRLVDVSFLPGVSPPEGLHCTIKPAGSRTWTYVVTAVHRESGEESLPTPPLQVTGPDALSQTASVTLAWTPVQDAGEYRVYRAGGGASVYGFLGSAGAGETYTDTGRTPDFDAGPPEARNPFSGEGDWPSCAVFWQQRLCFAGTRNGPQTIWASRSGAYGNFSVSRPLRDDDAVTVTIAADTVSAVRWLMPARRLLVGTGGGEWTLSGQGEQPFSPLSCSLERQSSRGSGDVQPLSVGDAVLALQRGGRVVREFRYSLDVDGYAGTDLTILAEHLTRGRRIIDWAWQQSPSGTVWCVTEDGGLIAMTRIPEHEVAGWHRHVTDGAVLSVCTIPGTAGDELWVAVRREGGGMVRCCIERLDPPFDGVNLGAGYGEGDTAAVEAFFVDSGLSYRGDPVVEVGGLEHLEGRTVHLLADGAVHPPQVVAEGRVRLDRPASVIHAGLPFMSELVPMPFGVVGNEIAGGGRPMRATRARVRLHRSLGLHAGPDATRLRELSFRTARDVTGTAPSLFSGEREVTLDAMTGDSATVVLRQHDPLPCTVLAVAFDVEAGEI